LNQQKFISRKTPADIWWWCLFLLVFTPYWFCVTGFDFNKPKSTIVYASDNSLLSAAIAEDGQWRFPEADSVPYKFRSAILTYEDQHFYEHPGVYLPSVFRALSQNIKQQKVISGASTITMQTIRLSRNNPGRTWLEKLFELFRAMRLEWAYSKDEILAMYASNAPFGGNVVGLDAAAWRYYGRRSDQLSWAEAATLAVLPNAPALIFPGKNQELLLIKRNRLLQRLHEIGFFDDQALQLSFAEPLPQKPFPLPQITPHLLNALMKSQGKGQRFHSTIDIKLQQNCSSIVEQHIRNLEGNLIHNAAVLVVEVSSGNVLTYIGNSKDNQNRHGNQVDIIAAPRSTGSILKPLLYAAMLKDGLLLPNSLVADIPIQFDGFSPKNYTESYDGAVPASRALSRSLNIPSVIMLREYGYARFYHLLKKLGFNHFTQPADHYGLSIILGGGEASLWDITKAYAGMSRTVMRYHKTGGGYMDDTFSLQHLTAHSRTENGQADQFPPLDAGSVWCTFRALLEVNRPETELGWEAYSSSAPIAWKTGTSFGNRDAWAVGTTPEYVIGVWVGNADGQGRPFLTGINAAAPLMFDIFSIMPHNNWFEVPYDNTTMTTVCRQSGLRPGINCIDIDTIRAPLASENAPSCGFHELVYTDIHRTHRLTADCASTSDLVANHWFVLPPVQEHYYKIKHPEYSILPPYAAGCGTDGGQTIGLIYPKSDAPIYLPKNFDGNKEKIVLQATHRRNDAVIFWHLNGQYLGETSSIHQIEIDPSPGIYTLTLTDETGQFFEKNITIITK
jgi:penicillin-binding protein 1C